MQIYKMYNTIQSCLKYLLPASGKLGFTSPARSLHKILRRTIKLRKQYIRLQNFQTALLFAVWFKFSDKQRKTRIVAAID
jgi:hypothetical protein